MSVHHFHSAFVPSASLTTSRRCRLLTSTLCSHPDTTGPLHQKPHKSASPWRIQITAQKPPPSQPNPPNPQQSSPGFDFGDPTNAPTSQRNASTSEMLPDKWAIAIAASIIHALHGTAVYIVPSTLVTPMRKSLSLTVSQITLPIVIYRLLQATLLLPASFVINFFGPQLCLRASVISAAILTPFLSLVTSQWHLISLQILFSFTKLFGGLSTLLLLTTRSFPNGKGVGTATSIVLSGISLAGFFGPTFIGTLSIHLGWRLTSLIMALLFGVVAVPLCFHYLRIKSDTPSFPARVRELRERWTNKSSRKVKRVREEVGPIVTMPYALVLICVCAFSFAVHLMFDHLIVFLHEDRFMSFSTATKFLSLMNLSSLAGKLSTGPLSDRYDKSLLITIFGVLGSVSSLFLLDFSTPLSFAATTSISKVVLFCVFFSISWGSVFSLTTSILPELGMSQLVVRSNLNLMIFFGSGSAGSYLTGVWRSTRGSYTMPFFWNIIAFCIVTVCGIAKLSLDRASRKLQSQATPAAIGGSRGGRGKHQGPRYR